MKIDEEEKESETSIKLFVDGKEICSLDYTGDKEAYKEKLKEFRKTIDNTIGEDKDIPLIPDDELFTTEENILTIQEIDYNFKVLKEKINQVVKEFNEYRKENK